MKSKQQGRLETSCQKCIFAIYDKKQQTGCKQNRLEQSNHFEAYNEDGEFYVVDGYCNLLRHEEWNDGVWDEAKFNEEISFNFFVVIDLFALTSNEIKKIEILYDHPERLECQIVAPINKKKEAFKLADKLKCKATITEYKAYSMNAMLEKKRCSYIVLLDNNESLKLDLNKFNQKENKNHVKPVMEEFEGNSYISCLAYQYAAYQAETKSFDKNLDYLKEQIVKHEKTEKEN